MTSSGKTKSVRSAELIHHFRCMACGKWWSVGDAPIKKTAWFCPWCGKKDSYPVAVLRKK